MKTLYRKHPTTTRTTHSRAHKTHACTTFLYRENVSPNSIDALCSVLFLHFRCTEISSCRVGELVPLKRDDICSGPFPPLYTSCMQFAGAVRRRLCAVAIVVGTCCSHPSSYIAAHALLPVGRAWVVGERPYASF